jgi:hypothetical protein
MKLDPEYLRQHYALLNDEALLAVDRAELVEMARVIFDEEVARRELPQRDSKRRHEPRSIPGQTDPPEAELEIAYEPASAGDKPSWLDEAAEVYSHIDNPGAAHAPDAANARDVLEAAGIPCYLELSELSQEKSVSPQPTHQWRLMVPGELNLRATSILDRDIFNAEFEAEWKAHLEGLSDADLRAMSPQVAFCGLFDRIERVNRVYDEEIARRLLK